MPHRAAVARARAKEDGRLLIGGRFFAARVRDFGVAERGLLGLRRPDALRALLLLVLRRAEREVVLVCFALLGVREAAFLGVEDVERPPSAACFLAM